LSALDEELRELRLVLGRAVNLPEDRMTSLRRVRDPWRAFGEATSSVSDADRRPPRPRGEGRRHLGQTPSSHVPPAPVPGGSVTSRTRNGHIAPIVGLAVAVLLLVDPMGWLSPLVSTVAAAVTGLAVPIVRALSRRGN